MKNDIINVANEILEDVGFEGISMRNIAIELEVSATALYRHFANKDAIVEELVKIGFQRLMKTLTTSLNEPNAEKRLKACLNAYIAFGIKEFSLYSLMFQIDHAIHKNETKKNRKYRQPVNRFIEDRIADVLKIHKNRRIPPLEFSRTLWCFMHGFILLLVNQQIKFKNEEVKPYVQGVLDAWVNQLKS